MTSTIYKEVFTRLKTITQPTLRSIFKDAGQLDDPQAMSVPAMPCALVKVYTIEWEGEQRTNGYQMGTANVTITIATNCNLNNYAAETKIPFDHEDLVELAYQKVGADRFLRRVGNQENEIVTYDKGQIEKTTIQFIIQIESEEILNTAPKPNPVIDGSFNGTN